MKKSAVSSKKVMPTRTLDHYFSKAAKKFPETKDDVLIIKEVKVPLDPHSAVLHHCSHKTSTVGCKPRRLRDALKNNKVRKMEGSKVPLSCQKDQPSALNPIKPVTLEANQVPAGSYKDQSVELSPEKPVKLLDKKRRPADGVAKTKAHASVSCATNKSSKMAALADTRDKLKSNDSPSLSLRVLDSQEYVTSEESKATEDSDSTDSDLRMDVSLLKRPADCILVSDSSSSDELSDDNVFSPKSKVASRSTTSSKGSPEVKSPATTLVCKAPPMGMSTPYDLSQQQLAKSNSQGLKGAKVARQLEFSNSKQSSSSNSSPRVLNSKKTHQRLSYRTMIDRDAGYKKKGSFLGSSTLDDNPESSMQGPRDTNQLPSTNLCDQGSTLAQPARPFTPDDDLEGVMLSLNDSNTFSPSKQSEPKMPQNLNHPARPFTPDDDLEGVMLSLNDSNSFSPTKQSNRGMPYYLASIHTAMEDILGSPFDSQYFNDKDLCTVEKFQLSTVESQMLYARMLFRKFDWIPESKLNYSEIQNKADALRELISQDLITCNTHELPLQELLSMLPAPNLKKVCRHMKIDDKGTRPQLIESMLAHTRQKTVSSVFKSSVTAEQVMTKWVKKELQPCYKLVKERRSVFLRLFMLYALVFDMPLASQSPTQSQLAYTMLAQAVGQIQFPQVETNRISKIFMKREHVLRRQQAQELEDTLDGLLQKKNFSSAIDSIDYCVQCYKSWISDKRLVAFDKKLPIYLRRYTCTSQMLLCMSLSADILQKLKLWSQAVDIYELMLSQEVYSLNSRGYWYERLSLIYHSHIKDSAKAADAIVRALNDSYVRVGHRLSIYLRGKKLQSSAAYKNRIGCPLDGIRHDELVESPSEEIDADGIAGKITDTGQVNVFLGTDARGLVTGRCSVEEVAMKHYMVKENLDKGVHGESSVYTTLFGLLFWDIIFQSGINDTFFNNYQCKPLDFQSDVFYPRRKRSIDKRLREVRRASRQKLAAIVEPVWRDNHGQSCICISWDVFQSADDVLDLMLCLGTPLLADICERLAKGYRFCRSGMPDLTMWNGRSGEYKIVEVKGPGDTLSTKQRLWLDYLVRRGAKAVVCHVKIAGSKASRRQ